MAKGTKTFDQDSTTVWVQPDGPNTRCYELLATIDALTEPLGDVATRMVRVGPKQWDQVLRSQGLPGDVTLSLSTYRPKVQGYLSQQVRKRCPMTFYIHQADCERSTIFNIFDVGQVVQDGILTQRATNNLARVIADSGAGPAEATQRAYEATGMPISPEYFQLEVTAHTVNEDQELTSIAFCNEVRCQSSCGSAQDVCEDGFVTAAAAGGASADVFLSTDGMVTNTVAAANPFAADEDVVGAVCFKTGRDVTRRIVGRGTTDGAAAAEIAYSDDGGATWTNVDVGSTNAEFIAYGGALFALGPRDIWCGLDSGDIYKSEDGGITWPDQVSNVSEEIFCIHFADEQFGMAVGDQNTFLYTMDGGTHWNIGTGPVALGDLMSVHVIDESRAWVISAAGVVYYTNDFGTSWSTRALNTTPNALGAVHFKDAWFGSIGGYRTVSGSDYVVVYRTVNGGMDWEEYMYDTAIAAATYGVRDIYMCDENKIYAVGDATATQGILLEVVNNRSA